MMYNLLLSEAVDPAFLNRVLADIFEVSRGEVDVKHEEDFESRKWDALVSVDYSIRTGDASWALSIYASDDVLSQPSEERLSRESARSLGVVVLFPPVENFPSLWKLATPRGEVVYARTEDSESGLEVRVIATEIPIPEIPDAKVSRFPEVIKQFRIATPIVDSYMPGEVQGKMWDIRDIAANWESLTVRMASGWPPSNWYPADMYEEDLQYRDQAQMIVPEISGSDRALVVDMFAEIDEKYRRLTVDDSGRALAEACGIPLGDLVDRSWYWRRRPTELPWEG